MKIGVFDSGIGGLSVLHCARKLMPQADFVYYADVDHVPYGEKKPEEIKEFVKEIFDFMLNKNVDAIVIACNTATSITDKEYRKQFNIPIIGMEPAVKKAVELYGAENQRILVAATPVTINGSKLKKLSESVDKEKECDYIALPGLVHYAEEGNFDIDEVKNYLREELKSFDISSYGTVVLGCTHFNYFKENFQSAFGEDIHFIDGNEGTIRNLINHLPKEDQDKDNYNPEVEYYFSGRKATSKEEQKIKMYMTQLDKMYDIN